MLKDLILDVMNEKNYKFLDMHDTSKLIQSMYPNEDLNDIVNALVELEKEHLVIRVKRDKLASIKSLGLSLGTLEIKRKGFGFVRCDGFDVFIKKDNLNGAINKDVVLVKITKDKGIDNKEGYVHTILEHGYNNIIGEARVTKGKVYVVPDDKELDFVIRINKNNVNGASEGSKVLVELLEVDPDTGLAYGRIKDVIGHINDVGIDILSVVYKYNFNPEFTKDAIKQANRYSEEDIVIGQRRDLRDMTTITIDGADAKDLDDAICLTTNEKGNRVLYVSIADVSYYVNEGSPLDKDAYERGTSVYLVDRVVPMLPHVLSNGICSLLPEVDRLTQTCMMEFDSEGNVINSEIFESIINSKYRMTYDKVNEILVDQDQASREAYATIVPMLEEMFKLSLQIREKKVKRGMLDFEIPEPKIIVDETGYPIDIVVRARGEAERIIEDFMIVANETVASTIYWMDLPFIYRVHEDPNPEKITAFLTYLSIFGIKLKGKEEHITPKDIQGILNEIKEKHMDLFLDRLLLRSMAKAKYDNINLGHFGLASKYYTHFTSPIRRYPDLLVHRLLRKYLYQQDIPTEKNQLEGLNDKIGRAAEQSSQKERDAIEAEREVNDMKMAEYMEDHVGEEFDGIITSITSFGFFVELENTVEGLVHITTLDGYYTYNEKFHTLMGAENDNVFKIAQKVRVKCVSVDVKGRNIDFEVVKDDSQDSNDKPVKEKKENKKKKAIVEDVVLKKPKKEKEVKTKPLKLKDIPVIEDMVEEVKEVKPKTKLFKDNTIKRRNK